MLLRSLVLCFLIVVSSGAANPIIQLQSSTSPIKGTIQSKGVYSIPGHDFGKIVVRYHQQVLNNAGQPILNAFRQVLERELVAPEINQMAMTYDCTDALDSKKRFRVATILYATNKLTKQDVKTGSNDKIVLVK
jgi:hypothetical protein